METAGLCRFCKTPLRVTFADLGLSPIANALVKPDDRHLGERLYPLHAFVCESCFLVQLEEFEPPEHLFGDYVYFSSFSESWLAHARRYVEMITDRLDLTESSQVVELASNDGYLLQYFQQQQIPVLGVEPAANVAKVAEEKGVPTLNAFFGIKTAEHLAGEGRQADLLIANNVLAHVPDLNDFVAGMKRLLKPEGTITLEFPHLLRLVDGKQFDTIYHEHFSYFSLTAVTRIFAAHQLLIYDVEELPTHGGSLRIYACHQDCPDRRPSEAVETLLTQEEYVGIKDMNFYREFGETVKGYKRQILETLIRIKDLGKSIAGYGAPAKGNTLLNYCGIGTDFIDYTVDKSPYKQGLFLPGTRIPIYHPDKILETRPDYLLILPWNIKQEIMEQMSSIREWGGQFLILIPEIEILDHAVH